MLFSISAGTITSLICLAVMILPSSATAQEATLLVRDGQATAEIVIDSAPPRSVTLAARELQHYLERISGAVVPIVTRPDRNAAAKIYVGRSTYTDELGVTDQGLTHGAYRMVSGDNYLILLGHDSDFTPPEPFLRNGSTSEVERVRNEWDALTGETWEYPFSQIHKGYNEELDIWEGDRRGSLNAVYAFLRQQGVRWYFPTDLGEIVPKTQTIALPEVNATVTPDFEMRIFYQYGRRFGLTTRDEVLWQLRLGVNHAPEGVGDFSYALSHGVSPVHARAEVKQAHPEFYLQARGERDTTTFGEGRPCLSSQGLLNANVAYVRTMFDLCDVPMVSIMPQDGYTSICECDLCEGRDTPERGWSGQLSDYVWNYVNQVAAEVYTTHPDRPVSCLAYTAYQLPPARIERMSPNLFVGIAQARLRYPEPDVYFADLRQAWLDKLPEDNKQLWLWEYYTYGGPRSSTRFMPVVFPQKIARDLRSLKNISRGEFVEVFRAPGATIAELATSHINLFVTARLWWDADQDVNALLDEYYTLYYGPARNEMKAFLTYAEANWMDMAKKPEKISQAFALLAQAQARVAPDSVHGRRIAMIADYMEPLHALREQLALGRQDAKSLSIGVADASQFTIDGDTGDSGWAGAPSHELVDIESGQAPRAPTTFKAVWAGDALYLAIHCAETDTSRLNRRKGPKDDSTLWNGDCVEILLETQTHSYYQIAVNPAGTVVDLDRRNDLNTLWSSGADIATHIGPDGWTVEMRVPVAAVNQNELDPLDGVAGSKPSEVEPWFFNVCRQRLHPEKDEYSAFSPVGKIDFHDLMKFAAIWVE